MSAGYASNVPKLYAIRLLFWMQFFAAVLVPFYTDWGGITLQQVFLLNAWFFLCNFLFEVPTGTVADFMGRKWSLALGSAVAIVGVVLCMIFVAGARLAHLGLIGGLAVPVVALAIYMAPYRLRRVLTFMDPWADPRGAGFQIIQSYLALGGGGFLGRGLGESKQKLFYLPEPHTDFIFAILGEELGFLGTLATIALFGLLLWRGIRVGLRVADPFGALLAFGVTALLVNQAVVNMGVVVGLFPTKGLPLPFVSSGGSSLLVTMAAVGILLNVSQRAEV